MKSLSRNAVFKPVHQRAETKNDITTRVAQSIIDGERASRDRKTERLKELRLAKEAEEAVVAAKPKPARKSRKR